MKLFYTPLLTVKRGILLLLCFIAVSMYQQLYAQVTTSSITGIIIDENKEPVIGANVVAVHTPSGSTYGTVTNVDGRFTIPSMRIGGPYTITTSYTGYESDILDNIYLSLGTPASFNITLHEANIELGNVIVTADRNDVFTSGRTGAANNITTQQLNSLPTLNRSFIDFARLTPQASTASFGTSFGGQDNRMNNTTIDGSLLNNSFGLTGEPGGRTAISPISLDAIEEVQVNLAPYDVRQAGFVGAGINAVTRSGTNKIQGSVFYDFRNESLAGTKAGDVTFNKNLNKFDVKQYGFRLGGPLVKNKLFFFINAELERQANPYLDQSNLGSEEVAGNKTRVLKSDLENVSSFVKENFGYETGIFENYDLATTGDKYLVKLDWNLSDKHRLSLRFNRLQSASDILTSNSNSLGFGNRRNNRDAMAFRNSNYIQNDNISSGILELNSIFGTKMSNNFIAGYTFQREDRGSYGETFPLIEIQKEAKTYITLGSEPFTPSNKLNYKTYQLQDNLSIYLNKHTITAGISLERLEFVNVFFPGSQGVFVYNSLEDFYTDLQDAKDNPGRDT
ncbi:MAG: carboxypeptidase-like regulatory domain-containing protein, partial [Saprospiraceae bacterium]